MHIAVKGIPYNDYACSQEELWTKGMGMKVSLSVDSDNVVERNAIVAYAGTKKLGYVRTSERQLTFELIQKNRGRMLIGCICRLDKDTRTVFVDVDCDMPDDVPSPMPQPVRSPLLDIQYSGPQLYVPEEALHLAVAEQQLLMQVQEGSPWNKDMSDELAYLLKFSWMDISDEGLQRLEDLLSQLRACAPDAHTEVYQQAAAQVQDCIDRLGSPDTRIRQMSWLQEQSEGRRVSAILQQNKTLVTDTIASLPGEFLVNFRTDPLIALGNLRYLRVPMHQLMGIYTLLALDLKLNPQEWESQPAPVPVIEPAPAEKPAAPVAPQAPSGLHKTLCVQMCLQHRTQLYAAEQEGYIVYDPEREGYKPGTIATKALVAYLCGKIFAGDYTQNGVWMAGNRLDDARFFKKLFGFDVGETRR